MTHHLELGGCIGSARRFGDAFWGEEHPGDSLYDRCLDTQRTLPCFIHALRLLEHTLLGSFRNIFCLAQP